MMDDNALEGIYKANLPVSHYAGLRGVWNDGYAVGAGLNAAQAQTADPSDGPVVTDASATADVDANLTAP